MNQRCAGFTLLEILVALMVLAIAAGGLSSAMRQSLQQQVVLEDKTIAGWVADNSLAEIRAARGWPEPGQSDERVEMAKRTWRLHRSISETGNPLLRKIEVAVSAGDTEAEPSLVLTGFVGKP